MKPDLPLYTEWQSGGDTYFVDTGRNSGESRPDWEARHAATVASMQTLFPPDP